MQYEDFTERIRVLGLAGPPESPLMTMISSLASARKIWRPHKSLAGRLQFSLSDCS